MSSGKRSPLKDKPLRQAGQSVQDQIDDLLDEQIEPYGLIAVFVAVLAGLEWYRYVKDPIPHPLLMSIAALAVFGFCAFKIHKLRPKLRQLKQGRDGEKIVGEFLERLRETGSIVFHDIVADGFNIDHVVVSEKGIFVVETKTLSKPAGNARVWASGVAIRIDGLGDQSKMADQAIANARWIREMFNQSTGHDYWTHPVLLFPGWYVEGGTGTDLWTLNPKALPTFIENAQPRLRPEDVKLAAYHLSRYIRASWEQ